MPLTPTRYLAACEVLGCDKQLEGTVDQLAKSSWSMRVLRGGIPSLEDLGDILRSGRADYPGNVVCPSCKALGYYKDMVKK